MKSIRRQKIRSGITLFSVLIFPAVYYYLSPYVPMMGAAEGVMAGSLVVFALLFLTAPFFGRSFCSWVCPAGAIQDQAVQARTSPFRRRAFGWLKYAVWAPWLGLILALFHSAGGLKSFDFVYATSYGFSIDRLPALIIYLMVVLTFYILALAAGRRAACHTVCWMAPFMILGRALGRATGLPGLRLAAQKEKCTTCGSCTRACPMSLQVQELVQKGHTDSSDCILCGRCADGCPVGCLGFRWK